MYPIPALLIKPSIDTRDDIVIEGVKKTIVKSRIGLSAEAQVISQNEDIVKTFSALHKWYSINVIICDECQFLTTEQVDQLKYLTSKVNIPVLCFGLRSDFRTKLFDGSKRLFEMADSISEIKSICRCGAKAIVNARFDSDGNIVTDGKQVDIGGNEKYEAMCWDCYQNRINHSK